MTNDSREEWSAGISEAFSYNVRSAATVRELRQELAESRRTAGEPQRPKKSGWSRGTAALRSTVRKSRKAPKNAAKASAPTTSPPQAAVTPADAADARTVALARRISHVLAEYDIDVANSASLDQSLAALGDLLDANPRDKPLAWLTFIAVVARFPANDDIVRFHTDVIVNGAPTALSQLLAQNAQRPHSWALVGDLKLIRNVVVDPTSTSHRQFHTGIQRVVRETVPRWADKHNVSIAIWGQKGRTFREPTKTELWRIMEFQPREHEVPEREARIEAADILVPWRTTVIVPEPAGQIERALVLSCLGEWSGNELTAIFHDFLVFTLPETLTDKTRIGVTNFNCVLRAAKRVSTVSGTVAEEVGNFTKTSNTLGFDGPAVTPHLLPATAVDVTPGAIKQNRQRLLGVPGLPLVISVSSLDPRKNHLTTLRAAEALWREGLQFQLAFIGWAEWHAEGFLEEFEKVRQRGRPVRIIRRVEEDLLWTAYRTAAFTVFIPLAEGFGLPAGESLAVGTPVVLSNRGPMAEVGAAGGALFVDPTDVESVITGMRTLLTDEARLEQLRGEAQHRPHPTWDDYADSTWEWLVNGKS